MATIDVNTLFSRAESDFRAGRYDAARDGVMRVLKLIGENASALHLLALIEQNSGQIAAARTIFVRALKAAPREPQINNNYANLLDASGEHEAALTHYDRALTASPQFGDARLNRATTLQKLGRLEAAMADLDRLVAAEPRNVAARATRGGIGRQMGRFEAAVADFQAALQLDPGNLLALHGCARMAMETGEEELAVPVYRRVLAAKPDDIEVALGLAEALEASGRDGSIPLLSATVARNQNWIAGHDSLARMRSEAGDTTGFDTSFVAALAADPGNQPLQHAHWTCLARGNRYAAALAAIDAAPRAVRDDPAARLIEAVTASEAGDLDRADAAFVMVGTEAAAQLARGRHELRRRDPEAAAALLEPVARGDLGLVTAWAHLGVAWRMTGDPRYDWLCLQPGLYGVQELRLDAVEIDGLTKLLRSLHRARAHPIGQSLRGGTQTRGELFRRPEPELTVLMEELRRALVVHVAGLPPRDDTHPLLRHRDRSFGISSGWSVRLAGGGFHINHVHPAGVLSSACYIAVPEVGGADKPGWLEIGAPPAELELDLPPVATIEPKPGRLVLFPSYLYHGTRPFPDGERLTVAFDVVA